MSVIGSNILAGASGQGGYFLTNSLRFRSSASASLSRTPSSATNRTTWTWSGWIKRGDISTSEMTFFSAGTNGNNFTALAWNNNNLFFQNYTSGSQVTATSTAVFRDPSAWYHVVLAVDTTQATAANRAKIYVNGVQQAGFSGSSFSLNQQFWINFTYRHTLSARSAFSSIDSYTDQYMAEVNFIDGQALTPSSFGETSTSTGVWIPKKYTGTYGTNGFYLKFTDTTSTSTLGTDFSGNSNTWTVNNISLTAGSTYDSMTDVPTLTSATAANYCVLNPLDVQASVTLTDGNLSLSGGNNIRATLGNFGSGKYYYEGTKTNPTDAPNNYGHFGIASSTIAIGSMLNASVLYRSDGNLFVNDSVSTTYASYTTNDVIGVAINCDSSEVSFYKNNTLQGTISFPTGITASNVTPAARNNTGQTSAFNFGQRPFAYTPPSGFVALNTFNLPTPTIGATASTQAGKYFNPVLYTGNGSTQSVTGVGFQPDWVWVKVRSSTQNHSSNDSVRGAGNYLVQNATAAERFQGEFDSFDSDGFSLTFDAGEGDYNASGKTYVAWNWRANQGTNVTNTNGSITSTVSASTTSGFSIVTYTGNGTIGATIGHGLGVAPSMLIVKQRAGGAESWQVYHSTLGATQYLQLNTTGAAASNINRWNNTAPTSTVFTVYNDTINNGNTNTYVAYCFAQIAGYSAFGSFTGNGSTDGTFVYTGFRPAFVMLKASSTGGAGYNWGMFDNDRLGYNSAQRDLRANLSDAESGDNDLIDFISNGFKIRSTSGGFGGGSGITYIYMAFAENPFKYANAR